MTYIHRFSYFRRIWPPMNIISFYFLVSRNLKIRGMNTVFLVCERVGKIELSLDINERP
jgi:hypothetical protein